MKLTYVIQMYKSIFTIKNTIDSINILYTGSHKVFRYITIGGILKGIVTHLYCTKYNEITHFIQMYKGMFRIQDHAKYFGYKTGYAWELLEMYFKLCFMVWFCHAKF